jgi:hypothetical protein
MANGLEEALAPKTEETHEIKQLKEFKQRIRPGGSDEQHFTR